MKVEGCKSNQGQMTCLMNYITNFVWKFSLFDHYCAHFLWVSGRGQGDYCQIIERSKKLNWNKRNKPQSCFIALSKRWCYIPSFSIWHLHSLCHRWSGWIRLYSMENVCEILKIQHCKSLHFKSGCFEYWPFMTLVGLAGQICSPRQITEILSVDWG